MENKFKKGLILGGILAVAAVIGFAISKKGKELSEELQADLKILAKHLKKNLHQMEDITKEKFDELVVSVVEKYTEKKKMAFDAKDDLIKALQVKWGEMEEEYLTEKDEENK